MRAVLALFLLCAPLPAADLFTGFELPAVRYQGPGEWRHSVEPVWVYAYPSLRLTYRAEGLPKSDAALLTLRPGSVGPVTPGAANIENPFVAGMPVVAVSARDLVADGQTHTLEVRLGPRMKTPQIDQLLFTLPAGATLSVEGLEFRGGPELLACGAGGPALPPHARALQTESAARCGAAAATSMRGREAILVRGDGRRGRALYLSLLPHFAGVRGFAAGQPAERWRIRENRQTSEFLVRLRYSDGWEEEQYPLSVSERRHMLVNGTAALYALELEPGRTLVSAELMDRSLHSQVVLFAAGITDEAGPAPARPLPVAGRGAGRAAAAPEISAAPWHRIAGAPVGALAVDSGVRGRVRTLAVSNTSAQPQSFTVTFPSVKVRPSQDPSDAHYVFPRQGAVISNADGTIEAAYNAAFPLQFVDVFAPRANSGVAVVVRDSEAHPKRFRLSKQGAAVSVEVDYAVRLEPGESWRAPEFELTPHGGDWHEGFAAYRQWVGSWYRPAGPRPEWLRRAFWARRDYPVGGTGLLFDVKHGRYTYQALIEDGQRFDGIDFIDISGWALSETAGRVGDYPIELGGMLDLRRNIALGEARGIPTGLYFEGYLIDKHSRVGRAHAADWQVIDAQGNGKWWSGADPRELFVCPYAQGWRDFLSRRVAEVARDTGAGAVYLDEFGFGGKFCYSERHGHRRGEETLRGEIEVAAAVRKALDEAYRADSIIYIEETPPDAAAPYFDAAFCYNLEHADLDASPLKLNLSRFVFPDIRLWDMVSTGIDPRVLPEEDFRLSLWHGNGLWLKGHSATWYGADLLAFLRRAHALLLQHAAAFAGNAEPLVESPHPAVFINRFTGGGETVHTLFNASYRTARFTFHGRERVLAPRAVDVVADAEAPVR